MDKPKSKEEVYVPTENELCSITFAKAKEAGYKFYCETYYSKQENDFDIYPYVRSTTNGHPIGVDINDLPDNYSPDAWKKYSNLIKELSTYVEVRPDIVVHGIAYDRGVELIVFDGVTGVKRKYQTTGKRNISTMRELAKALNDACDFVEAQNPEWASHLNKDDTNE